VSTAPVPDLPFDLTGPLPTGVTVLEASAGTGKTFTIAALAARFVADGIPLQQLLLVTFTRMATGELRERVRERLVHTEQELARVLGGAPATAGDEVVSLLASGGFEAVKLRRDRLARAISDFDAATIATTHGFCQEVLAELGTLGDLEPDVAFVEDIADLVDEVIDDLYLRRFWREGGAPFDRAQAGMIARLAIDNPTAPIHPLVADGDSVAAMRARLARAARDELEARKRALGLMTYDDLLTRLRGTLAGASGPAAAARLRARYRVVLIDEFQDTDPVQWEIVQRAFDAEGVTLVLIADPKQAIYAFRGADVYAYLAAVGAASTRATLAVNWRADQRLIDGFDALFGRARLGHPGIVYRAVSAAPANREPRLRGAPVDAALRIRIVDRMQASLERTNHGYASAPSAREHVARDLAADVVALLSAGAEVERRAEDGARLGVEPVEPGHIAVLVQSHRNAALVHRELGAAGVPAVINGAGSVFATAAAADWLSLLQALERPASPPRARSAALTPFLGWDATRVACAAEEELEELHQRLHAWARLLRMRGVAALAEEMTLGEHLPARLLRTTGGERRLTDLHHVGQVLHAAAGSEALGTAALTGWLRQRIAAAGREGDNDDLTRRLESDAAAVQVLTIHRSKGLEFPIVYCPFLWEPGPTPGDARPVYFHEGDAGPRAIDVGLDGAEYRRHLARHVEEERGEDLRLAYVALTRARHQAVVWWAGSFNSRNSPLGRLFFAQDADGNVRSDGGSVPEDQAAHDRFSAVADGAPAGVVSVEWSRLGGLPPSWDGPPGGGGELAAATFDRRLDPRWRRTSYSDITAAAHEAWVGSEPEEPVVADEPSEPRLAPAGGGELGEASDLLSLQALDALCAVEVPLGAAPVGARFGTFVHRVLEAVEFDAPDLDGALALACDVVGARGQVDIGDPAVLRAGLAAALATPVDDGFALRDLARGDRLDELGFELPLAGGDLPSGGVALDAIARLLRRWLPADDPLAGYADRLADPVLRSDVRGYLTGSIDLVLRRVVGSGADGGGRPRLAIVDYKTNWLGGPDEPLTAWHYRPAALAAEMARAHYALQALLYLAALHRYLRWRLPGYDVEHDLDGVHYLFLRGMLGVDAPVVGGSAVGVFTWRPPGGMVAELSEVLDGR
jgi:exodeoxyribonuclease V beta subunit